jgi:predicted RND superfamily exporter protein
VLLPLVVLTISIFISLTVVNNGLGKLDIMLSMLPTIVFVVGVSYSIHILSIYAQEYQKSKQKLDAIILTVKNIWSTIAITAFTTSFGFLSLYLIDIKPIQNFALYNAIAILITGVISILVLPILVSLFNPKYIFKNSAIVALNGNTHGTFVDAVVKKSKLIQLSTVFTILILIWGATMISPNNNFLDDLSRQSELGQELTFFESNFGGIRPFEMAVNQSSSSLMTYDAMLKMEKVHDYLENTYMVSGLISPVTIIKGCNKSFNSGLNSNYKIPDTEKAFNKLIAKIKKKKILIKFTNVISEDFKFARFYGRNLDYGSAKFRLKNNLLQQFLTGNKAENIFHLTGAAELMDATNGKISTKLFLGISLGVFVVTLLILIIFRSIRIALISIVPNVVPVIAVAGLMGFLNIDLKVATALAFTIIFGIAVDDTIHLLKRIKFELKQNNDMTIAIKKTYQSTGKAVVLTSLIISAGFLAFITSEFTGLFYFGILISVGIIFALISDYIILPILLLKIKPKRFNKQKS